VSNLVVKDALPGRVERLERHHVEGAVEDVAFGAVTNAEPASTRNA
jgi:hypothetical protein